MNSTNINWDLKKTVLKGNIGEEIVKEYLESLGYVVYGPETKTAHGFDRVAVKNKDSMLIAEIKTKAARSFYPDTGFNLNHYKQYVHLRTKYKIPFWIFFVDELKKEIYGNWLEELEKPFSVDLDNGKTIQYPKIEPPKKLIPSIIYFPLKKMIHLAKITDSRAKEMEVLTESSYIKNNNIKSAINNTSLKGEKKIFSPASHISNNSEKYKQARLFGR